MYLCIECLIYGSVCLFLIYSYVVLLEEKWRRQAEEAEKQRLEEQAQREREEEQARREREEEEERREALRLEQEEQERLRQLEGAA